MIQGRFLPLVARLASKNQPVDIMELNFGIIMDTITGFIFGLGNGSQFLRKEDVDTEWLHKYQSRRSYSFWDGEVPMAIKLSRMLGLSMVPPFVGEATAFIENWTMSRCKSAAARKGASIVDEHDGQSTSAVVYNQLTKAVHATTAADLVLGPPDLQVASELHDHIVAGEDTSSITLTYLYWELSKNPGLQAALREELLTLKPQIKVPGKGFRELPHPRVIDGLPLLHAVVMETLRIHPAIPGPQPRTTPNPPVSVAGSPPLDPGTRISAQAYTLHRHPDVFPDPEVWRPRRWLDTSEEKRAEMLKWFWAFGSGGRMCVGSNIAMQGRIDS